MHLARRLPTILSRRDFVRSAAMASVATAGSGLMPKAQAASAAQEDFVDLAIATICTDGFGNRHHEPAFRLIPEIGIKNVEFNVWFADNITPNYLASLKERSRGSGLTPVCVQGSAFGGAGSTGIVKDIGHKLTLMQGANQLGCRRIKCTGAARGSDGGLKSIIEICRELAPAAKEMDILILLENHAGNVLQDIADYDEIFSAIDSPYIGMCCDVAHFEGAGVDPYAVIDRFHSRLLHVDLKDNRTRGGGHDVVMYGQGVTDFPALLRQLQSKDYRGYLLVEMAWATPREPVVANLRKARELFEPYVRRV